MRDGHRILEGGSNAGNLSDLACFTAFVYLEKKPAFLVPQV
jgi:hypothetical protein